MSSTHFHINQLFPKACVVLENICLFNKVVFKKKRNHALKQIRQEGNHFHKTVCNVDKKNFHFNENLFYKGNELCQSEKQQFL